VLLGLNIGHDSSVVLADESGRILFASSEERLTRVKGEESYPVETLTRLFDDGSIFNIGGEQVSAVCIGTYGELKPHRIHEILTAFYQAQSSYYRHTLSLGLLTEKPKPGHASWNPWMSVESESDRPNSTAQALEVINQHLSKFNIESPVHFIRHHDAHAASGFFPSGFNDAPVIPLDGQGDGESGQIGHGTTKGIQVLARIPAADSLGHVYSAVTNRYGFKINRHEGKITGLAAYGDASVLRRNLEALVRVEQGIPDIDPVRAGLLPELREAFELAGQYKTDLLRVLVEQWD
jgi:carbamoyltransferase